MSKGDRFRKVDKKKFDKNYDDIFSKKEKLDLKLKRKNKKWVIQITDEDQLIELEME